MVLPALDEYTGIRVDFIFSYTPFETNAIKRAKTVMILGQKVAFAPSGPLHHQHPIAVEYSLDTFPLAVTKIGLWIIQRNTK